MHTPISLALLAATAAHVVGQGLPASQGFPVSAVRASISSAVANGNAQPASLLSTPAPVGPAPTLVAATTSTVVTTLSSTSVIQVLAATTIEPIATLTPPPPTPFEPTASLIPIATLKPAVATNTSTLNYLNQWDAVLLSCSSRAKRAFHPGKKGSQRYFFDCVLDACMSMARTSNQTVATNTHNYTTTSSLVVKNYTGSPVTTFVANSTVLSTSTATSTGTPFLPGLADLPGCTGDDCFDRCREIADKLVYPIPSAMEIFKTCAFLAIGFFSLWIGLAVAITLLEDWYYYHHPEADPAVKAAKAASEGARPEQEGGVAA